MSAPLILKDREWQLEEGPGQVPCWSTVIGGVLCRWWGTEEPPGHKELADLSGLRSRLAACEVALVVAREMDDFMEQWHMPACAPDCLSTASASEDAPWGYPCDCGHEQVEKMHARFTEAMKGLE